MQAFTYKVFAAAFCAAWLVGTSAVRGEPTPQLATYYRPDSVYIRNGSLVIQAAVLNEPTVNRAIELLDLSPELQAIH